MRMPESFSLGGIRLRRPRPEDAPAVFEYGSDPEVARFADWPVQTAIEPIAERIAERDASWEAGTEYNWVIVEDGADRAIGGVSCRTEGDAAEIGYLLNRKFWGKGYATMAAGAVVRWLAAGTVAGSLATEPAIRRIWATCDAENAASIRVLEKIGMKLESVLARHTVRPNIGPEPRDAYLYSMSLPRFQSEVLYVL